MNCGVVSTRRHGESDGTTTTPESWDPTPTLTDQFARTFWAFKQAYAAELGMSVVEYGILAHLVSEDGVSQQALASRLHVDPSLITRAVKEMERNKGWITRTRDERDNRLMRVRVTEDGRRQAHELPERAAAIEDRLTSALSGDERREFRRLLHSLEHSVREARQGDTITDG